MDIKKNLLDEIEGVGPGRKKALLHAFGSAKGVGRASVVDLVKVEGINQPLADRILRFSTRRGARVGMTFDRAGRRATGPIRHSSGTGGRAPVPAASGE